MFVEATHTHSTHLLVDLNPTMSEYWRFLINDLEMSKCRCKSTDSTMNGPKAALSPLEKCLGGTVYEEALIIWFITSTESTSLQKQSIIHQTIFWEPFMFFPSSCSSTIIVQNVPFHQPWCSVFRCHQLEISNQIIQSVLVLKDSDFKTFTFTFTLQIFRRILECRTVTIYDGISGCVIFHFLEYCNIHHKKLLFT